MPETFLQGVAEIDGNEYEVGPGDFMAFPTLSVPHHVRNPSGDGLRYFAGGENLERDWVLVPAAGQHER